MDVFSHISMQVSNLLSLDTPRPLSDGTRGARSLSPGANAVREMQSASNVTTGKGLSRADRDGRSQDIGDREEPLDSESCNELTPLILRIVNSFLPTGEKVRLIREVENQYARMDMAERPVFIRRMILLVGDLESDVPEAARNMADDREEVMKALRSLRGIEFGDAPEEDAEENPAASRPPAGPLDETV